MKEIEIANENKNSNASKLGDDNEKNYNSEVDEEVKLSRKERSMLAKIREDEERDINSKIDDLELTGNEKKIEDVNFLK